MYLQSKGVVLSMSKVKTNQIKKDVDLSVIIPVYNGEKYIQICYESLISQTYSKIELIFINDGSIDGTTKILTKILAEKSDIPITVVEQLNQGVSAARNQGLALAVGEYVMFVDGDDYVDSKYCEIMSNLIKKEKADVAMCNYYLVRPTGVYANRLPFEMSDQALFINKDVAIETVIAPKGFKGFVWNKIYRKERIDQINFSEKLSYLEDYFFNLQVINQSKKIAYTTECLYYYRAHEESAVSTFSEKSLTYFEAMNQVYPYVPKKIQGMLVANQVMMILSFGFQALNSRQVKLYKELKERYQALLLTNAMPYFRKDQKFIVLISQMNFRLGCYASWSVDQLLKTKIYQWLRKRLK